MPNPTNIKPRAWLIVSLCGFLLFIAFFILLLFRGADLQLSTPVYFFLLIMIALACTALLAGAMRSSAKYQNKALTITGPAVIFLVIVYLGYRYRPEIQSEPLSLSIQLLGPAGANEVIRHGTVNMSVDEYNAVESVNNKGVAQFTGISSTAKGKRIQLYPSVEGYTLDTSRQYFLDETQRATRIELILQREQPQISVNGKVIDIRNQKAVPDAYVQFEGVDSSFVTDRNGSFRAKLPVRSGSELRVMITRNDSIIFNSLRVLTDRSLLSFPAYEK